MVEDRNIAEGNFLVANAKATTVGFQPFHPGLNAESPNSLLSIQRQIASGPPLVIQMSGQTSNGGVLVL